MQIDEEALKAAKKYPIRCGKLFSCDECYIRDGNQDILIDVDCLDGDIKNVVFISLGETESFHSKFTNKTSFRVKILTTDGITGWISSFYFSEFKLMKAENQE